MSEAHDVKTPRLQVDDPLGPRVVIIDKPVFRIGRKSESDLRSVGTDVSREHAEIIRQDDGHFILKDRGSRCGTFVNDEQVTERTLRHRDKIGSAEAAAPRWCSSPTTRPTRDRVIRRESSISGR